MIKNFTVQMRNGDGTLAKQDDKPILMSDAIQNVLLAPLEGDKRVNGEEKHKMYTIMKKVRAGGNQEYSTEELAKIKECVGRHMGVLETGQIFDLIEGVDDQETAKQENPAEEKSAA